MYIKQSFYRGGDTVHLIHGQYKILDVFEKNTLQSLMLGSSFENPEDIAVINEIIWSPLFTPELLQSLLGGFINLQSHSEDDVSCQLVTPYHKGMPIAKYLPSRSLSFQNRINLCYEFLKAMVSYTDFPYWVQDILIDEDQIIVWEDQLLYNELLILKTDEPSYPDRVSFSRIQKKLHGVLVKMIGNSADASPALLSFMERLSANAPELNSLQAVYDDFQKVFLYDYYLNQDDTVQPAAPVAAIPVLPVEEPIPVDETELAVTEPDAGPEPAFPGDEGICETDPEEIPEDAPMLAPHAEMDAVDADMEKNLELFFNRDRTPAGVDENKEDAREKKKSLLWMILAAIGVILIVWAAIHTFLPAGKPVAAFTGTQKDGIWVLENKSTFTNKAAVKRCEWTVYQNGKLIDLYDTYDLTLALEEEGAYQVVLRVMDHDGKWSALYQETLENKLAGSSGELPAGVPTAPSGPEKMDQFTLKFTKERTHQDTAFFRTGSYSLQVSAGKKPEIIDVQGVKLDKDGMVSLWVASENTDAVSLVFTGYNKNTKVFSKDVSHKPMASRQWEMRQFNVESDKAVDRMTIAVKADSLINLDDLNIDSYK